MEEKVPLSTRIRRQVDWRDWRVKLILTLIGFSILVTAVLGYLIPGISNVATFIGAIYASWVAGIISTVFITLVLTFVQLSRADRDTFESRARMFLQSQSGPHIDYIVPMLKKLVEPYCTDASRDMYVVEHDFGSSMFRVNQETKTILKNYFADEIQETDVRVRYLNASNAPAGKEDCSLTYLKIDGNKLAGPLPFRKDFDETHHARIEPHKTCEISQHLVTWVKESTEPNRHKAIRFTRKLIVRVHNQLQSQTLVARHINGLEFRIPPGESGQVVALENVEPGEFVYDFRLELLKTAARPSN